MQSWFSSRGSILCCWLENDRPADHTHVAKCILRKVSANSEGVNQVFLYDHNGGTAIDLPESYLSAKAASLYDGWTTVEDKPNTKETVLISFAMQARARGFAIPLEKIDFSGPTQLVDSLISLLVEALHSVSGRVFLVFEWPGSIESANAASETLNVINGLLSGSRNRNLSHNCSVIMSVRETAYTMSVLKGYACVRADSEYQGEPPNSCLFGTIFAHICAVIPSLLIFFFSRLFRLSSIEGGKPPPRRNCTTCTIIQSLDLESPQPQAANDIQLWSAGDHR